MKPICLNGDEKYLITEAIKFYASVNFSNSQEFKEYQKKMVNLTWQMEELFTHHADIQTMVYVFEKYHFLYDKDLTFVTKKIPINCEYQILLLDRKISLETIITKTDEYEIFTVNPPKHEFYATKLLPLYLKINGYNLKMLIGSFKGLRWKHILPKANEVIKKHEHNLHAQLQIMF